MIIPKIIHFIFVQGVNEIHDIFLSNIDLVRKQNPNYEIKLWDKSIFLNYLDEIGDTETKNYFNRLNPNIYAMLTDYMRYVIIYNMGGTYLDLKSRPRKPLDQIIKPNDNIIFVYTENKENNYREYWIGVLISKPKELLYKLIINHVNNNIDNYDKNNIKLYRNKKNILNFSGPHTIIKVIDKFNLENPNYITIQTKEKRLFTLFGIKDYKKYYNATYYGNVKEHLVLF